MEDDKEGSSSNVEKTITTNEEASTFKEEADKKAEKEITTQNDENISEVKKSCVIDSKEATTIGEKVEVVQKEITIVDNKKSRENKVDQDDSSSPNSQSPNFSSEKDSKETTGEDQDMASKVTKEEKENPTASEIEQPHSELNCQKSTFFDICKNTNNFF